LYNEDFNEKTTDKYHMVKIINIQFDGGVYFETKYFYFCALNLYTMATRHSDRLT